MPIFSLQARCPSKKIIFGNLTKCSLGSKFIFLLHNSCGQCRLEIVFRNSGSAADRTFSVSLTCVTEGGVGIVVIRRGDDERLAGTRHTDGIGGCLMLLADHLNPSRNNISTAAACRTLQVCRTNTGKSTWSHLLCDRKSGVPVSMLSPS